MSRLSIVCTACFFAISLAGCCDPGSEPLPPYGKPDDVYRYTSGDYASVDYTYYCLNGEYVSVTYIRPDECSDYHLESEFRSSGICSLINLLTVIR
jgi:hypothetical protein